MMSFFCCSSSGEPEYPTRRKPNAYQAQVGYAQEAKRQEANKLKKQKPNQAQRPGNRNVAPVQQKKNPQPQKVRQQYQTPRPTGRNAPSTNNGGMARPQPAKLAGAREPKQQLQPADILRELERRQRRRDAIEASEHLAAKDGFLQTPTLGIDPTDTNRLSRPFSPDEYNRGPDNLNRANSTESMIPRKDRLSSYFEQSELNRADSTKSKSTRFPPRDQIDAFAIGECSEPPSPIEEPWESGVAQYERQPGLNGPMRYPRVSTIHSFTDDGQVSPLGEEFFHGPPVRQVRESAIISPANRPVSYQATVEKCSDTEDSLSDWSGTTKAMDIGIPGGEVPDYRRSSSLYGSPYDAEPRRTASTVIREPPKGRDLLKPRIKLSQPEFEDIHLESPSNETSKPDSDRFLAAYAMLTDNSKVEGGKAARPIQNDGEYWMV